MMIEGERRVPPTFSRLVLLHADRMGFIENIVREEGSLPDPMLVEFVPLDVETNSHSLFDPLGDFKRFFEIWWLHKQVC